MPANLKLLNQILQESYRVLTFSSGIQALKAAARNPPDLILLDIMMPEMDGFEACRRLKEDDTLHHIPIIFISALDELENKVHAFGKGAVDYIIKPFHEEEVLARVDTHLKIVGLQRQLQEHNDNLEKLVAKRTRELAFANTRLQEMACLKDNFLSMISHELRTPANGVLALGELLIGLCPDTDDSRLFADLFHKSSERMRNLLEDATLIASIDKMIDDQEKGLPLEVLMAEVKAALPQMEIRMTAPQDNKSRILNADGSLLKKATITLVSLAACFSQNRHLVCMEVSSQNQLLELIFPLDAFQLTQEQATSFFDLESPIRASSQAEDLGLAPVVAHQILCAIGGGVRFIKENNAFGYLRAFIPYQGYTEAGLL